MTLEQRLLEAAEQKLLRPLDVQFALMVAKDEHPAVMLAAALPERVDLRFDRLGPLHVFYKRQGNAVRINRKLREHRVAQHFCCNGGAV